jgi:hypothetical protein
MISGWVREIFVKAKLKEARRKKCTGSKSQFRKAEFTDLSIIHTDCRIGDYRLKVFKKTRQGLLTLSLENKVSNSDRTVTDRHCPINDSYSGNSLIAAVISAIHGDRSVYIHHEILSVCNILAPYDITVR